MLSFKGNAVFGLNSLINPYTLTIILKLLHSVIFLHHFKELKMSFHTSQCLPSPYSPDLFFYPKAFLLST